MRQLHVSMNEDERLVEVRAAPGFCKTTDEAGELMESVQARQRASSVRQQRPSEVSAAEQHD